MRFKGKTVLVTGSTRGIGKATAEGFAKEGADVIINYIETTDDEANKYAQYLADTYSIKALAIRADVGDDDAVAKMRQQVEEEFGKLDVLVNNAGIVADKPYLEHTKQDFENIFSTNVYGVMNVSKAFADLLTKSGKGAIVSMSSTSGMYDFWPDNIDYAGSKIAVQSMTRDLAIQYGPSVRVNAVALGWADTDMNKNLPQNFIDEENEKFILGRMAEPREVANVIIFLASDDASFVNGTTVVADGGRF